MRLRLSVTDPTAVQRLPDKNRNRLSLRRLQQALRHLFGGTVCNGNQSRIIHASLLSVISVCRFSAGYQRATQ